MVQSHLRRSVLAAVLAVGLGGAIFSLGACTALDPKADKTAREAYAHYAKGEDDALYAMLEPGQPRADFDASIKMMHTLTPPGPAPEGKATSWNTFAGTNGVTVTLAHVYSYPDRDVTATTVLAQNGDRWLVRSFNVNVRMKAAPTASTDASAGNKPAVKDAVPAKPKS